MDCRIKYGVEVRKKAALLKFLLAGALLWLGRRTFGPSFWLWLECLCATCTIEPAPALSGPSDIILNLAIAVRGAT